MKKVTNCQNHQNKENSDKNLSYRSKRAINKKEINLFMDCNRSSWERVFAQWLPKCRGAALVDFVVLVLCSLIVDTNCFIIIYYSCFLRSPLSIVPKKKKKRKRPEYWFGHLHLQPPCVRVWGQLPKVSQIFHIGNPVSYATSLALLKSPCPDRRKYKEFHIFIAVKRHP